MSKRKLTLTVFLLSICLILPVFLSACDDAEGGKQVDTLVVYNWEDYIDESEETSRLDAFAEYYEEVTGNALEIVYTTFDTNETMLTKVLNDDADSVDLICPSDYAIQKLMADDRLENLSSLVSRFDGKELGENVLDLYTLNGGNMSYIEPSVADSIQREFDGISVGAGTGNMADYMVPYMMGTVGILYNVQYVTEEDLATGWGMLWNESKSENLENMILVKDSVRDTYVAAVMYLRDYGMLPDGYENLSVAELINCTDDALLAAAEEVLTAQRAHISGYEVDFGKDDMLNEIVYVDLAWSGDALWAIEESYDEENLYLNPRTGEEDNYTLDYFVPTDSDGHPTGNIWFDGWVVPKKAPNKLAAVMFIDFMNRPENAVYNSVYIGYTSGVSRDKMMFNYVGEGGEFTIDEEGNYVLSEDGNGEYDVNTDVYDYLLECEYAYELSEEEIAENDFGEWDLSYFDDERRYPTDTAQLGVMRDFADRSLAAVTMWENAKTGKDVPWVLIWCSVAIVGAIGLFFAVFYLKQAFALLPKKVK